MNEQLLSLKGQRVEIAYLGRGKVAGILAYHVDHGWVTEPEGGKPGHVLDLGRIDLDQWVTLPLGSG